MSQTFTALGQTWTKHTPGDPMPCEGKKIVIALLKTGAIQPYHARDLDWGLCLHPYRLPIIGWRYAETPDQPKAEPTERIPTTYEVQSAFEDWLASKCPSGDHDTVMRQWHESSDYLDLFRTEPTELERLREENRLMRDAIKEAFDLLLDGENTRAGSTLQPFIKP